MKLYKVYIREIGKLDNIFVTTDTKEKATREVLQRFEGSVILKLVSINPQPMKKVIEVGYGKVIKL